MPYRNLKSENSQDYAQKPQQNCTFINSASAVGKSDGEGQPSKLPHHAPPS